MTAPVRYRSHQLYRMFDAIGVLLYIGITCNLATRIRQHGEVKPWWESVARIDVEQYPDRESVMAAEREAIQREAPLHNIKLNTGTPTSEHTGTQRIACSLKRGTPYALGLRDSNNCPVGLVVDGDESGVVLTLYSWLTGMFVGNDIWVAADKVERWVMAEPLTSGTKRKRGFDVGATVFGMDELGDFQEHWKRRQLRAPEAALTDGGCGSPAHTADCEQADAA